MYHHLCLTLIHEYSFMRLLSTLFLIISISTPSGALAANRGDTLRVDYGTIVGIRHVKLDAHTGKGAALGGLAGLAASRHEDSRDRNKNVAAGLILGALISKAANSHRDGEQFTIALRNGSEVSYTTEHRDLENGDCVAVEQGKHVNLRRVSNAMCEQPEEVTQNFHQADASEALECQAAKQTLLEAEDQKAAELAAVKVQVLCHH